CVSSSFPHVAAGPYRRQRERAGHSRNPSSLPARLLSHLSAAASVCSASLSSVPQRATPSPQGPASTEADLSAEHAPHRRCCRGLLGTAADGEAACGRALNVADDSIPARMWRRPAQLRLFRPIFLGIIGSEGGLLQVQNISRGKSIWFEGFRFII
uniref:Uncharacterized protein n=1 Tax=Triticum urartu TaxID=4572 RepID=A0A8R7P6F5_TRIUA